MKQNNKQIEQWRVQLPGDPRGVGNNGTFRIPCDGMILAVVASDGEGWDHVSVHVVLSNHQNRIPTWLEMCYIKRLFFMPSETVVQFHPPESQYRNCHPETLHLWRCQSEPATLPPEWMV